MRYAVAPQHPRPRTLIHPGRPNPVRMHCVTSRHGRHVRLSLPSGASLFDAIVKPLARLGIESASITLLGGYYDKFQYSVAPSNPSKQTVIAYGSPIHTGQTYMVFGTANLGEGSNGLPLIHCHATLRTESGELRGGHVLPERCIVGSHPITALVIAHEDFVVRQVDDSETNMPALQPYGVDIDE